MTSEVDGKCETFDLRDTLHVPDLRCNLLSVGKIVDKGFRVLFDKERAKIIDTNNRIRLTAERRNGLFFVRDIEGDEFGNSALQSAPEDGQDDEDVPGRAERRDSRADNSSPSLMEWHQRLGHLNFKDLREASRKGTIVGLNIADQDTRDLDCEICLQGKMTRSTFPKKSLKTTQLGDIVHSDVCGPMRVASNGGAHYLVTFVDDATGWCEVRFLRQKNEVFNEFKSYRELVKTQHGKNIRALQPDNGTEYVNSEFDTFLRKHGIQRRLTAPGNPEQNGVAERRNRTLIDATRCLLLQSGLPPSFWAEALSTANYIRNRCPTAKLQGKTPHEAWTGRTPDVSHFMEFGRPVYCLNRAPNRGKLDVRSKKEIFLGYADGSKAFRVWVPEDRKVEVTRDVRFLNEPASRGVQEFDDFYQDAAAPIAERMPPQRPEAEIEFLPPSRPGVAPSIDEADDGTDDEVDDEIPVQETPRRGPGRPRKILTGKPGKPRKLFHMIGENQPSTAAEPAFLAEVPIQEAVSSDERQEWISAIEEEFTSILDNDTWEIVDRPAGRATVGSRIVLRNKHDVDGNISRRKARVVARGFSQRPGLDFNETFAPVARLSSIRLVTALAARENMHVRQFDVTTAYLNGVVDEEIFMEVPEYTLDALESIVRANRTPAVVEKATNMIHELSKGGKVCLVKKALYGLRQAGRCWNKRLDRELRGIGATPSACDPSVYQRGQGPSLLIIVVYVDDIMVVSRSSAEIDNFGTSLKKVFDIRDLGEVKHCLGMEFNRDESGIKVSQGAYIRDILKRFRMEDCHAVSTPIAPGTKLTKSDTWLDADGPKPPYRELTGALMYLSVATRPDVSHAASLLCQFNDGFGQSHWRAAKRVLRYLKGTQDVGIFFKSTTGQLLGFADADWGACPDDRRSFTGYAFTLGGGVISWESRKQRTVALSTTEAEYMALSDASKEAIYLKRFLNEMGESGPEAVTLFMDNAGAVKLATNPVFHSRTKHIAIRHHFVREAVDTEEIRLEYLPTEDMPADVLTKGLPRIKHWRCLDSLGIVRPSSENGARFEGDC